MSRLRNIWLLLLALVASVGSSAAQGSSDTSSTDEVEYVDLHADAPIFESDSPRNYCIREIRVHGVDIDPQLITRAAGIIKGDSIMLPGSFSSLAVENLWDQKRYSNVKLGGTIDGDDIDLDIYLEELPRVFRWDIQGLGVKPSHKKTMLDELKFKPDSELSEFNIEKGKDKISKFYFEKGYRNIEVEARVEQDSLRTKMVNVTFDVDRKSKVKIGEVQFIGNEAFSNKKLERSFKKTRRKSIWNLFKSSKYNQENYDEDIDNMLDFYNARGYRNAMVVSDSIYDINDKRIGLLVNVSEGNKYYIRNISWVGNSQYETEQMQRVFAVESGDVYDKTTIDKRLGIGKNANPDEMSILTVYQNEGYLMSQIEPAEVIIGADSIDLEIKVYEGNPFTINRVTITGNERLDDEVIRRELYTRPGELYNRSMLMQTMRMLSSMGHFNAEGMIPSIDPVTNNLVDIGWPLVEQPSDQFSVSGGWGNGTFVASVGVTLNNLSVRNIMNGDPWTPYPMGQNQKLSLSAQTNGTYYKAFSLGFSDGWMGGRKPNTFSSSAFYSDQNNAYYAWESSTQHFRILGISAGLGKRLSWPDPYFTLYGELSYQRYMLDDWSSFIMTDGTANMISAGVTLSRSTVDQSMYPRRGTNFTASLQITPPYSLFDGKDYSYDDDGNSKIDDEERYKFIEFHKWNLKAEWYQSFMKNSNLVLKLSAEMGYLGNYNPDKVSPFERFEVGGDGMSGYTSYGIDVISIRGYEDGALDPLGSYYSVGYNKYTMELRYPIVMEPSSQVYVLAFAEGGNGFSSWKDFLPFNIKRSAGFGVRIYLPIVGMLGLDWGYGFDYPSSSAERSGSQIHFTMGQQF
ncbi:MAG: POTRA domain-containing protein [Rikenellaceae bacterium]